MDEPTRPDSTISPTINGVIHRYVDAAGLRMHVAESGAGEPVVLLHGFPQHWWEWRHIIPSLAERHRVIAPDLRGAGSTDAPSHGYRRDQLLADVVALLDELGLDRVHLVAHDWGALVGYQLCLRHPERVRSFLCLGPHPFARFSARMLPGMWRLWFQFVIATPGIGPRLLGRGKQRLVRHLLHSHVADASVWSEEDVEAFLSPFRDPARARAASALYRGFILREVRYIATGWYKKFHLSTPTRVLHGGSDAAIPVEALEGFERYADRMSVEILPGVAHYPANERPEVVVARALELFARE